MPSIDEIADEYVARAVTLDPFMATCAGIGGHHHELPELRAEGFAERAGLDCSTLMALDAGDALHRASRSPGRRCGDGV